MTKIPSLKALVLGLVLAAACSSSDPPSGGQGGTGGTPSTGAAGKGEAGGATGGAAGKGGAAGGRACAQVECVRPYQCRRSCAGPIEYTGCCACEAPLFDDFGSTACGGSGGAIGGSGGGAAGPGGGTAGSGGSARAGSGGNAGGAVSGGGGGSGGLPAGSGGSARGGSDGSAGASGRGGGCGDIGLCLRPYECRRSCGRPIEYTGCCPCQAPLFDDFHGAVCGDAGVANASYAGCGYVGGADRLSIAKVDVARDLCVYVRFSGPGGKSSPGLTLWGSSWGLEAMGAGPAAACTTHSLFTVTSGSVTGTATAAPTMTSPPSVITFDFVVTFPASDAGIGFSEPMTATNLAVPGGGCVL